MHLDSRLDDDRLRHAINAHVAEGIVVRRAETCRDDFHARFDASSKRYLYLVVTTRFAPPFGAQYFHWTHYPLDFEPMKRAARALVGTHDFKAFGNTGSPRHTTVRTIQGLRFIARKERLALIVQADGFLYNMVRTIAGTLLAIGRGRLDAAAVERALKSGDRDDAGPTAPPSGLYLVSVQYDERAFTGSDCGAHGRPGVFRS
jgi:tRNA pseudouridine38-40 synthase